MVFITVNYFMKTPIFYIFNKESLMYIILFKNIILTKI